MWSAAVDVCTFTAFSLPLLSQAVRASSAAPYYLDDYVFGEERYQDGAATANNPAVIAVQQARLLWPHTPLEALVSLGCGSAPPVRRWATCRLLARNNSTRRYYSTPTAPPAG